MNPYRPLVTVLINNYNYGRFLREAVDSALNQTYRNLEVIVVDDGSTDDSREVIRSYGDRIVPHLKENEGQASAINAGIELSRGEIICLLDADDVFYPSKVQTVIAYFEHASILHHRLQVTPGFDCIPPGTCRGIDFYRYAQRYRFLPYVGSPTSGIVIQRELALRLIPLPNVRSSADDFLVRGAALLGDVVYIDDVLGKYRVHGDNAWYGTRSQKPADFMGELERYLNRKLVEANKDPVIDFYHSMYAREYILQTPAKLVELALSVFRHHSDLSTFKFMVRTLGRASRRIIASPLRRDRPMNSESPRSIE